MFKNFSVNANKVMKLAEKEARAFNHEYVGTEHILLALVKEGGREKRRLVHRILSRHGVNYKKIKARIKEIVRTGPEPVQVIGKLPVTPRGKKVINYAAEEAQSLSRRKVTIEDLLVGLLREKESIASQILHDCGVEAAQILRTLALGVTFKKARAETVKQPKRLASIVEKKERPVKCRIFKIAEMAAIHGNIRPVLQFRPIKEKEECVSEKVEAAITDFLSDGKELVRAVQSSVSIGVASAVVITHIAIYYRDKDKGS